MPGHDPAGRVAGGGRDAWRGIRSPTWPISPDGTSSGREVKGRRIALYRLEDGYFATSNVCTHANVILSVGEVVEGYIECPLHFGLFEIRTGKAAGAPVSVPLATFPVRLDGTRIEVELAD